MPISAAADCGTTVGEAKMKLTRSNARNKLRDHRRHLPTMKERRPQPNAPYTVRREGNIKTGSDKGGKNLLAAALHYEEGSGSSLRRTNSDTRWGGRSAQRMKKAGLW